jgi:glutathione-independent formaldehyde dehydrogenase
VARAARPTADRDGPHRVWLLQELHRGLHRVLSDRQPGIRGGSVRLRGHGSLHGWPGRVPGVPYADFNCTKLPPGTERESDFILLADIFPTGYDGCELAQVSPGETVAVYGGGPVGLMAAYSALLRGPSRVFVVDPVPERLQKAEAIGAIPINFERGDPVEQIKEQTNGEGADKGVDAVGYQAQAREGGREEPAVVLNSLIRTVRATGALGVPGLYVPADPGAPDELANQGMLGRGLHEGRSPPQGPESRLTDARSLTIRPTPVRGYTTSNSR